jgi:glycerate-2-kinase
VKIQGLARDAGAMKCRITDATRGMQELPEVSISGGEAAVTIPPQCLLTLSAQMP